LKPTNTLVITSENNLLNIFIFFLSKNDFGIVLKHSRTSPENKWRDEYIHTTNKSKLYPKYFFDRKILVYQKYFGVRNTYLRI
jgi:hypothetical protein